MLLEELAPASLLFLDKGPTLGPGTERVYVGGFLGPLEMVWVAERPR